MLRAMSQRATWIRIAAAILSAVLVAGLFPPFKLQAMVWLALIPLLAALWSLNGSKPALKGFLLGWLAGTVSCAIQFYWFSVVSSIGAVLIPIALGLYWAAFGAFAATLGNPWKDRQDRGTLGDITHSVRYAFCIAVVWAGLEWLRSWLFTGFGWNSLGVAFHNTAVMAQAADILGLVGLSIVPVFLQATLLQTGRRMMDSAKTGKRRTRIDFGIAALMVAFLVCYGLIRIAMESQHQTVRLKALLVQLNIPQDNAQVLWSALDIHMAFEEETLKALEQLTADDTAKLQEAMESANDGEISLSWPDWVMWPEAALSGSILTAENGAWGSWEENLRTIGRVREPGPFQLIYGVTQFEGVEKPVDDGHLEIVLKENARAWNSLAVMSPQEELQLYQKQHLVLFGEYIPLVESIPLLKYLYEQQSGMEFGGSFSRGTSTEPMPIPLADGTVIDAIPTICFEDSVARLTRKFVRDSPQVIINVTNDGWFKESPAAAQHFANSRFRAIELRRPMLRCANNGVSAAIDTIGSISHPDTGAAQVIVDEFGSHFTRGSILAELDVPVSPSFSLYALIGDWGIILISLSGLTVSILCRNGQSTHKKPKSKVEQLAEEKIKAQSSTRNAPF